jgi:hypothetical protein
MRSVSFRQNSRASYQFTASTGNPDIQQRRWIPAHDRAELRLRDLLDPHMDRVRERDCMLRLVAGAMLFGGRRAHDERACREFDQLDLDLAFPAPPRAARCHRWRWIIARVL